MHRSLQTRAPFICLALLAASVPSAGAALKVVATTSDLAWFAREVGGERVEVSVIARGYQDPHYVEPKPSYIVGLSRADLLVFVGLELEIGWLPRLLDGAHNPRVQEGSPGLFTPAPAIQVLEKPAGALDRSAGDIHPYGNPHYWLDPDNAARIALALAERLADLDPAGAAGYRKRAAALARTIAARDAGWKARLAPLRGTKLVTYHKTFSYFLDHFRLEVVDYIEPKPGVPPSSRHLSELVDRIKAGGVKLLLIESFFDVRDAQFVASKTGIPMRVAPVSVEGVPEAKTWFDLIEILVRAVESPAPAPGS